MPDLTTEPDEESEIASDADNCDSSEIEKLFPNSSCRNTVKIHGKEYVLHLTATSDHEPYIALGLSNNICHLYKLSTTACVQLETFTEHPDKLVGCKFSSSNTNILYTSSCDGTIKLWDIRTPAKSRATFTDSTVVNNKNKVFNCFDVSGNDRLLAAGTDLVGPDAFLLFWDTRNQKLLGGYWESHSDDITQVKFHPDDMNKLVSGSTDGLINIYDLSQSCEDKALIDSLNTESTVEQILWFNTSGKWSISCITHVADVQLWNLEDGEPYKHITRSELAIAVNRLGKEYIYVASHQAKTSLLLLVGSNYADGECIRGLNIEKTDIFPAIGFKGNQQRVRCSWYNENINLLLTGGEKGILDVWQINKNLGQ